MIRKFAFRPLAGSATRSGEHSDKPVFQTIPEAGVPPATPNVMHGPYCETAGCLSNRGFGPNMPPMNDIKPQGKFALWIATGLGVGLVSPAPGTIGGLWGLPLAWAVGLLPGENAQLLAIVLLGLASVAICSAAARALGGSKDPQSIVLDEIAALPIVFLGVEPAGPAVWLAGWLLFRLFDITKPMPICLFERLPGGWGIMADDWAAAAVACAALHGLLWLDRAADWGMFAVAA